MDGYPGWLGGVVVTPKGLQNGTTEPAKVSLRKLPMSNSDETIDTSNDDSVHEGSQQVTEDGVLHVYGVGEMIVFGFAGRDVPSNFNLAHYRDEILKLIEIHNTKSVAFDVTGVKIVPSGMLGLWASLHKQDIALEVYNPSEDIQDVLEITKLDKFITVKQVDV